MVAISYPLKQAAGMRRYGSLITSSPLPGRKENCREEKYVYEEAKRREEGKPHIFDHPGLCKHPFTFFTAISRTFPFKTFGVKSRKKHVRHHNNNPPLGD